MSSPSVFVKSALNNDPSPVSCLVVVVPTPTLDYDSARCSFKGCRQLPVVGVHGLGGEETEFCGAHSVQGMQDLVRGLPTA